MVQQTLGDIFSGYVQKNKGLFVDRNTLSHDYIPELAVHRETQTKHLAGILAPALSGAKVSNVFLYGKTGTGKTLVARQVTSELERTSGAIKVMYINCKMKRVSDTEYRLFAELARGLGRAVPPTGLPTDHVYRTFFNALDSRKWYVVLVLDEIDALVKKIGDDVLYNLSRANQDLKMAKISIIGISNNISFMDCLDPRVKSSLSEEEIIFPPYNATQLQDILKQRAELAFMPGALGPGVIEKCAALAAQEHGDARKALDLLRVAAELAERANNSKITTIHVDMAEDKLDLDRISEVVRAQPKQSLAVLSAIVKLTDAGHRNIQTGDIFSVYERAARRVGLKTLTQRRVSDLIAELDMLGVINAKVISKGRYGRTREIGLNLPEAVLNKIRVILKENDLT